MIEEVVFDGVPVEAGDGAQPAVMVAPGAIDDDAATVLSHEIAREIEKEVEYPGQIKITVIRESRAIEYAR